MCLAEAEAVYLASDDLCELESHLQACLSGRVAELRLTVQPDGLVLQGRTRTYYAKQVAQQALMKATPVPILANDIEVV